MTTTPTEVPLPAAARLLIELIIERFDFERVHTAMKALDWEWGHTFAGPDLVPEIEDLQRCASELLEYTLRSDLPECYISTGGFVAQRDESGGISLAFQLESQGARENGEEM